MTYQGRALYNLLQMNYKRDSSIEVEEWQIVDYRSLGEEELFKGLEKLEVFLDRDNFLLYVNECDSPENLVECLSLDEDYKKHEQVFLLIFELWRRLAPHKQSLSIFVDEFDHLIEQYEGGNMGLEEELQGALSSFQSILDDNVDEGGDPKEGYRFFSTYSCHNLELFIYEYIAHQIDIENSLYASEILEGFYSYLENQRWLDFLRARLVMEADPEEGAIMIERLLGSLKDESEIYLLFEILHYLIHVEEISLFQSAYHQALDQIKIEEELRELLSISIEYFHAIDKEKEEALVNELLEKRKEKDLKSKIGPGDEVFEILKEIIILLPVEVRSLDNLPK